jgi:hypothetical protein
MEIPFVQIENPLVQMENPLVHIRSRNGDRKNEARCYSVGEEACSSSAPLATCSKVSPRRRWETLRHVASCTRHHTATDARSASAGAGVRSCHLVPSCTTLHHLAPPCTTLHHLAPPCRYLAHIANINAQCKGRWSNFEQLRTCD